MWWVGIGGGIGGLAAAVCVFGSLSRVRRRGWRGKLSRVRRSWRWGILSRVRRLSRVMRRLSRVRRCGGGGGRDFSRVRGLSRVRRGGLRIRVVCGLRLLVLAWFVWGLAVAGLAVGGLGCAGLVGGGVRFAGPLLEVFALGFVAVCVAGLFVLTFLELREHVGEVCADGLDALDQHGGEGGVDALEGGDEGLGFVEGLAGLLQNLGGAVFEAVAEGVGDLQEFLGLEPVDQADGGLDFGGGRAPGGAAFAHEAEGFADGEAGVLFGHLAHDDVQPRPIAKDGEVAIGGRVGERQVLLAPGLKGNLGRAATLALLLQSLAGAGGGCQHVAAVSQVPLVKGEDLGFAVGRRLVCNVGHEVVPFGKGWARGSRGSAGRVRERWARMIHAPSPRAAEAAVDWACGLWQRTSGHSIPNYTVLSSPIWGFAGVFGGSGDVNI